MESLVRGITFEAGGFDRVARWRGEGAGAVELVARQERLERGERHLGQQHLGRPVADTQVAFPCGILLEAVRVRSLDAVHAPGVLTLYAAEKAGCRATVGDWQEVGHLERMEVGILGVRDL